MHIHAYRSFVCFDQVKKAIGKTKTKAAKSKSKKTKHRFEEDKTTNAKDGVPADTADTLDYFPETQEPPADTQALPVEPVPDDTLLPDSQFLDPPEACDSSHLESEHKLLAEESGAKGGEGAEEEKLTDDECVVPTSIDHNPGSAEPGSTCEPAASLKRQGAFVETPPEKHPKIEQNFAEEKVSQEPQIEDNSVMCVDSEQEDKTSKDAATSSGKNKDSWFRIQCIIVFANLYCCVKLCCVRSACTRASQSLGLLARCRTELLYLLCLTLPKMISGVCLKLSLRISILPNRNIRTKTCWRPDDCWVIRFAFSRC